MSYPKAEQIVSILNNKRLQRMRCGSTENSVTHTTT